MPRCRRCSPRPRRRTSSRSSPSRRPATRAPTSPRGSSPRSRSGRRSPRPPARKPIRGLTPFPAERNMSFDVVVIGLGAVGSAAAYQLAKRGAKVLGIDRHSPPHAMGSSHGDTRITRLAIGEGSHYTPLVLRANEIWREVESQTGEDLHVVTGMPIVSSDRRRATTHVANFFENTIEAARGFG